MLSSSFQIHLQALLPMRTIMIMFSFLPFFSIYYTHKLYQSVEIGSIIEYCTLHANNNFKLKSNEFNTTSDINLYSYLQCWHRYSFPPDPLPGL